MRRTSTYTLWESGAKAAGAEPKTASKRRNRALYRRLAHTRYQALTMLTGRVLRATDRQADKPEGFVITEAKTPSQSRCASRVEVALLENRWEATTVQTERTKGASYGRQRC